MKIRHLLWAMLISVTPVATSATDMAERVKPCEACHGNQGRAGPDGYYPRLAGKPAGYLYNQMQNFSEGRRHYPMMRRMMAPLSSDYQREMAHYFASLQVPYLSPSSQGAPPSPAALTRGQQLALEGDPALKLPACNTCHGEQLMGLPPHIPGLLGLPAAYLGAQLSAWRLGDRRTQAPDCMANIAKRLTAEDAAAVTGWMAAQKVPTQATQTQATRPPADLRCASAPGLHGVIK